MSAIDRRRFLQGSVSGLAGLGCMPPLAGVVGCQALPSHEPAARTSALPTAQLSERVRVVSDAPGNVVALSSSDGIVLVDSGSSKLCKAVRASVGGASVHALFNTHYHVEQTGGNALF